MADVRTTQLARELGLRNRLFDNIDERPLLPSQCKQLIERLLGCAELMEPEIDADAFTQQVKQALRSLPPVYNPTSGKMVPWIDVAALQKHIRKSGSRSSRGSQSGGCCVS